MLIEYSTERKDEDMQPSAIEVRRRVGARKLQEAVQSGALGEKEMGYIKDMAKKEMQEQSHEQFTIRMASVTSKITVARAEQQLNVEKSIRTLEKDVSRASRLTRQRIDVLSDLEVRILKMRHSLVAPSQTPVDEEVGLALRQSNTTKTEKLFKQCFRCQRKILVELLETHSIFCAKVKGKYDEANEERPPVYDLKDDYVASLTTFPPQPPRLCRVKSVGSSAITWEWEPPISDGGLPIYDYEIQYFYKEKEFDRGLNKNRVTSGYRNYLSTWWAFNNPACHKGCRLINLKGGSEYKEFKIRSRNLHGWSDWGPMIVPVPDENGRVKDNAGTVYTNEPEKPSPPLFFVHSTVTGSCIYVTWEPPIYDGGQELVDFIVCYTPVERHITAASRDVYIERPLQFSVGGPHITSAVIRNVLPDTKVIKIGVKAQNSSGLASDPAPLAEDLRTLPACRHSLVKEKLKEVANSKAEFIDTDFYNGIQQRLKRLEFLRQLNVELKTLSPDPLEVQEEKEWAAVKELKRRREREEEDAARQRRIKAGLEQDDNDEEDTQWSKNALEFTNRQRLQHYKDKIQSTAAEISELVTEKYRVDSNRGKLTLFMKAAQKHQMKLRLERDRVKNYQGALVSSDILIGAPMQYQTKDLLGKIDHAFAECTQSISDSKYKVISGENRKADIKARLAKLEDQLKERQAALVNFQQKTRRMGNIMSNLTSTLSDEELLVKHIGLWKDFLDWKKGFRDHVFGMFMKVMARFKRSAFDKWGSGKSFDDGSGGGVRAGQGTTQLQKVTDGRRLLQSELRELISSTHNIHQSIVLAELNYQNRQKLVTSRYFKGQEEGMDHRKMEADGMHYVYEAEGYANVGNFFMALSLFETQIISLRSKSSLNIKLLAVVHGKMAHMFLKQGRYDRALVDFDRQLSLANEINDQPEIAHAYYGLGIGYLKTFGYDDAIKYLEKALTKLLAIGNIQKYTKVLHYLDDCLDRLGKFDKAAIYKQKIKEIEGQTAKTISDARGKLSDLTERLRNTSAGIEHEIKLERSSLRAMQLKHEIKRLTESLDDLSDEQDGQRDKVEKIEKLLTNIQGEIQEALNSDESEMMSMFVHDQPQMVEVEELKTRLDVRKRAEIKRLTEENEALKKMMSSYTNVEADINALDEQLDVETGALATHSRDDKPFRCVSFCSANAAGDEITGTSAGGVEFFVAAEGKNLHVLDYTGDLMYIISGDEKRRVGDKVGHVGVVTCLLHDGKYLFSGSADETIIAWDAKTYSRLCTMRGHEGTVQCVAAEAALLVSGSADMTVRLWDKLAGTQLRVIYGHQKSILSIDFGATWMLTGSADEEARVWSVTQKSAHTINVVSTRRLQGHDLAVCIVKYGLLELFTGDISGRVFIWWAQTGKILRMIQCHQGPIKSMQFDAVNIVTGGTDNAVAITDIATGEVVQSLRAHTGHVLCVAFDSERIVSCGGDNTLRYWAWGKKEGGITDKIHNLSKGETLISICKQYGLGMQELLSWNGIKEMKNCFEGMKLIVKKANPSQPTAAEKAAMERERRRLEATQLTVKKFKADPLSVGRAKYNRVRMLALDQDTFSMGNRMFKVEKHRDELFPDKVDPNRDQWSLGSRIARDKLAVQGVDPLRTRYFIAANNLDEWADLADAVGLAMLGMFVEYDCYEVVKEMKRAGQDSGTVIGRINKYHDQKAKGLDVLLPKHLQHSERKKRFLMPEERRAQKKLEKLRSREERRRRRGEGASVSPESSPERSPERGLVPGTVFKLPRISVL